MTIMKLNLCLPVAIAVSVKCISTYFIIIVFSIIVFGSQQDASSLRCEAVCDVLGNCIVTI